jgi:nucleotide-binding universal stress UspA family protein
MTDTITRILVPVDFSPHAERAFCYAITLAQRLGADVELLHVVDNPFVAGTWSAETYSPNIDELLTELMADAEHRLDGLKESAAAMGVTAETLVLRGRPWQSIVERAAAGGVNLIVMATHGRTGLAHAVVGSVAERVVRNAQCPVLTIRSDGATRATTPAAA